MERNLSIKKQAAFIESGFRMLLMHRINLFLRKYPFRGSDMLKKLLEKLLIPVPEGSTLIHTIYGFDIIVDPIIDEGLGKATYFSGVYEAGTLYIIEKCLRQGDIFIDVGANIGLMSLLASLVVGKNGIVYSFEPESESIAILRKNIEINAINNINAYNVALGTARDSAFIFSDLNVKRDSASLLKSNQENCTIAKVLIETLDEFITINNIPNIKMIKIDVEGWELEVLKGANRVLSSSSAPIICVEYSNLHSIQNGQLSDIYDYILAINNYYIYKLEKGKGDISKLIQIRDSTDLPWHDNLFCFLTDHLKHLQKDIFV